MVSRKLRILVSRKAKAAASKETANIPLSSNDRQLEPTLVCRPCSLPTVDEVPVNIVTNKSRKKKWKISESEGDEGPITTAIEKDCKSKRQNPEIQGSPDPFDLMMSYFDKCFAELEKKLKQSFNKNVKIEDTFKFRHEGNRVQYEVNEQILQIAQNLSSAFNNCDASEAKDLCGNLTTKLGRRNKLIKMADRSVVGWETVAVYETDQIARDSDEAKNRERRKRRSKKS